MMYRTGIANPVRIVPMMDPADEPPAIQTSTLEITATFDVIPHSVFPATGEEKKASKMRMTGLEPA